MRHAVRAEPVQIVRALDYYLIQDVPTNTTEGSTIAAVTGFDAVPLFDFVNVSQGQAPAVALCPASVCLRGPAQERRLCCGGACD